MYLLGANASSDRKHQAKLSGCCQAALRQATPGCSQAVPKGVSKRRPLVAQISFRLFPACSKLLPNCSRLLPAAHRLPQNATRLAQAAPRLVPGYSSLLLLGCSTLRLGCSTLFLNSSMLLPAAPTLPQVLPGCSRRPKNLDSWQP